ncbi:MAG: nucleotidyltransferase family protein [Anaerosomatales bacterium]|nr:nucleotidyltransferase family protein [Anaerosomatales bacterium]MDT8435087.1 nucleotidyltransferase family protein [Anaerosomatales bacterium]
MREETDVLRVITESAPDLARRFGARRLAVFGSAARGHLTPDSDIDVLVDFTRPSFDDYMDLKFALEDLTGRSVDLVMVTALKPRLRDRILSEARDVA